MSGIIVPLMRKTRIDRSYLGPSATETIIIKKAINVSKYYRVQLWVRVHERNIGGSNGKITLSLNTTLPSSEDPREFSLSTAYASYDVTSVAPTGTMPAIASTAVLTDPGPYIKFSVVAQQHTVANTALFAELSAALLLREH